MKNPLEEFSNEKLHNLMGHVAAEMTNRSGPRIAILALEGFVKDIREAHGLEDWKTP